MNKNRIFCSIVILGLAACTAGPAVAGTQWTGRTDNDWDVVGNWSFGVPDYDDWVAINGENQPVNITTGMDAQCDELMVGRERADGDWRAIGGSQLNISGGSLTMDRDQFCMFGVQDPTCNVNQTGGTVNLGNQTNDDGNHATLVIGHGDGAGGVCTYTLDGPNTLITSAADGDRTMIVTHEGSSAHGTFGHIRGTLKIGKLYMAATSDCSNQIATYNLEGSGRLEVDEFLMLGRSGDSSRTVDFNFRGGALTRDSETYPGDTNLTLQKAADSDAHVAFTGWGVVDFNLGVLSNDGRVVADGQSVGGRSLDMSCFAGVTHEAEPNAPSADGWFAVNKGRLLLPNVAVALGDGGYNWGETVGDEVIDRVSSAKLDMTNVTVGGDVAISLLAPDHDDIIHPDHTFVGVWKFEELLEFTTANLTFRYDQIAAAEEEIEEANLGLFASGDGSTWTQLTGAVDTETKLISTTIDSFFDVFYAVGASGSAPPPLPGDANNDGIVNDQDASILAAHWQLTDIGWDDGDFNGDGIVNDQDASILAAHWQEVQEGAAPVSEPATLVLLAGALAPLWFRRRFVR